MGNVTLSGAPKGAARANFNSKAMGLRAFALAPITTGLITTAMITTALLACPAGESHTSQMAVGAGGVSTEYIDSGGAPPIAGSAGAGAVGGMGQPVTGGETQQPMAGDTSVAGVGVPAGAGGAAGTTPIEGRVFDAGTDPARNNVQAGQLCSRLAQIQCAGEAFCCDNPGRDRPTCENIMRDGCMTQMYLDAISSNAITAFDAATAAVTFGEIERLASTCDASIAAYGVSREGLMGMFRGTAGADDSCAPGLTMDRATAAAKLASCTDISTIACLPSSPLTWRCKPRSAVGGDCFTDVNCHDGLYCPNPNFAFGSATCADRKPFGAPCALPNECASLFCKGGSCVDATQQAAYCLTAQ